MVLKENTLYSEHADDYDLISSDRNFTEECVELLRITGVSPSKASVLELFAGPAYHSSELKKLGAQVHCIDSSYEMQKIAIEKYGIDRNNYLVGILPEALGQKRCVGTFDLAIVLRFSIGLVNWFDMEKIIEKTLRKLKPGGALVLELHRLDLLTANFDSLEIKERQRQNSEADNFIKCIWPSGPIKWDLNEFYVEMPISIEKKVESKTKIVTTISREWIYVVRDFEILAKKLHSFEVLPESYDSNPVFKQSKIIILRRK